MDTEDQNIPASPILQSSQSDTFNSNENAIVVGTENAAPTVFANPASGTPLLTSQADLRQHVWGGIPHRVTLTLYNSNLTIVRSKDGQTLLSVALIDLRKVKRGSDYITFKVNGKRYTLEFALLGEKTRKAMWGGPIRVLSAVAGHSGDAKEWKEALVSRGVAVGKAWA